jgi:hypothetical protein
VSSSPSTPTTSTSSGDPDAGDGGLLIRIRRSKTGRAAANE